MNSTIQQVIKKSNAAFMDLVWNNIKSYCGGGTIIPVETVTNTEMTKSLDMLAGIDVWQIINYQGMRGIASRVQWCNSSYQTFTSRFRLNCSGNDTEWQKRKRAIETDTYLYPHFTCQAYISNTTGLLMDCAIAKTKDIYSVPDEYWFPMPNGQDGNIFVCLDWWRLDDVFVYPVAMAEFISRKRQQELAQEVMDF